MADAVNSFLKKADDPERSSLFGMLGSSGDASEEKSEVRDDGGSHIMREAIEKVVREAQVHKLYLMDMEEEETITEYLKIKNGNAYNITKETPFEKVIEYTGEGEHTKEVRYKRIVEYTTIDSKKLMEALVRETKLTAIPSLMGFTMINKYFPESKDALKDEYKSLIKWVDPEHIVPTPKRKSKSRKKVTKK